MVFDIVSRDDENLLKVCDVWKDMKDLESHHSHNIILKDGIYKWEQTNFDYGDLNRVMYNFYNNGLTKNSEEVRAFYRSIGYSLFGYWELVYWDVNNPIVMDYLHPDSTIEGYRVWSSETITHNSDILNKAMTVKLVSDITSNLKNIIKPDTVALKDTEAYFKRTLDSTTIFKRVDAFTNNNLSGSVVDRIYCYQFLNGEVCGIVAFDNIYQSVYNVYTPKG